MRTQHLFVTTIGLFPMAVFALTVWLSDGAPFQPVGRAEVPVVDGIGEASTMAIGASREAYPAWSIRDGAETEREYLYRMAREGDRGAALLLTVLDDGGVGAAHSPRLLAIERVPRP